MDETDEMARKLAALLEHGGPASPVTITIAAGGRTQNVTLKGMTIRDWFAGQAITGALANGDDFEFAEWDNCAKYAYALADAMLAERGKKQEG